MKTNSFWLTLLGTVFFSTSLFAGVRAQMRTDLRQSNQSHVLTGEYYAQGERIRLDQTMVGLSQSTIVDFFSNKVTVLLHARKIYVESSLDDNAWRNLMMRGQIPKPQQSKGRGYQVRLVREEVMEKHPCQVMEVTWTGPNKGNTLLWLAKDLDGVVIKSATHKPDGMSQTSTLYEIRHETLPDTLFKVPPDYARSSEPVVGFDRPHS